MAEQRNISLQQEVLNVVENQLRDRNPPETKEIYDKLIADGFSDEEARQLIGQVVVSEIFGVLKNKEAYNHARFVSALKQLPEPLWDKDD